jgi:hypothetical protein
MNRLAQFRVATLLALAAFSTSSCSLFTSACNNDQIGVFAFRIVAVDTAGSLIATAIVSRVNGGVKSATVPVGQEFRLDPENGGLSAMTLEISAPGYRTTRVRLPRICGPGDPQKVILQPS